MTWLVFGSIREILSIPPLEIQTASGPIPTQSGTPGIGILAMIGSEDTRTEARPDMLPLHVSTPRREATGAITASRQKLFAYRFRAKRAR
jgi:hypothetical protein